MSDMPERVWVRWMETYIEQSDEGDPCAYEYIRADKYADLLRQRDELVELTTTLMSYAARDEDESKSILGYAIYAPPWLIRDLEVALAKAEKDDE